MRPFYLIGLLGLFAAPFGQAAIVYTQLDTQLFYSIGTYFGDSTGLPIDFNKDGNADFLFNAGDMELIIYHQPGTRVFILSSPPPNIGGSAASILGGTSIDGSLGDASFRWFEGTPPLPWLTPEDIGDTPPRTTYLGVANTSGSSGHTRGKDGYIGLEFLIDGQAHYAWVHLDSTDVARSTNGEIIGVGGYITGWAWETEPGKAIIAGAIPEPSVITLAAISLAACFARRKRYGNPPT